MEEKIQIVSPPVYRKHTTFTLTPGITRDIDPYALVKKMGVKLNRVPEQSSDEIEQEFQENYWYEDKYGNRKLNENVFAEAFCAIYKLNYSNGTFYSVVGAVSEEKVKKMIWESIRTVIKTNVDKEVTKLYGAVKLCATVPKLIIDENLIPFLNGDLDLKSKTFNENCFSTTAYRLGIDLPQDAEPAPNFTKWLHDLFYDEDIPTIQQYLGYCFIPTTRCQKTLLLVGEGGAGKSVMGVIINAIFGGCAYNVTSTQEVLNNRFLFAELENKLVLYDDDLDSESFSDTGLYKKLVTNTSPIMADKKYGKAFKFTPFARIICCTNEMITSTNDNAEGFYRRLLPVAIKPKAPDFKPDPKFYDKIRKEKAFITLWALKGLFDLIQLNDFVLPQSLRSLQFVETKQMLGDPFPYFIKESFDFNPEYMVSSVDIKNAFYVWCTNNAVKGASYNKLVAFLTDYASKFNIQFSYHIPVGDTHVRGFVGMKLRHEMPHEASEKNVQNPKIRAGDLPF